MSLLEQLAKACIRTVFPGLCVACRCPLRSDDYLCGACQRGVDVLRAQPACPGCGLATGPHLSFESGCATCRSNRFAFDGTARAAPYQEIMATVLRQFKYHGAAYLDDLLASWMIDAMSQVSWNAEVEAIVPVPAHWRRRLSGGLYPARLLAAGVARRKRLPCLKLVRRARFDGHQIGLSLLRRRDNVREAFQLGRGVMVHGAVLAVVDDVMTSGATLHEVARVLKHGGASRVYNVVLARAGRRAAELGLA